MFSSSTSRLFLLALFLLCDNALSLPIGRSATLMHRAPVANPCVTANQRTDDQAAAAAASCFQELRNHILIGGKTSTGVLGSDSGGHLASGLLGANAGVKRPEKLGPFSRTTMVMTGKANTETTKSVWLDVGLKKSIEEAEEAQAKLNKAEADFEKAKVDLETSQKKSPALSKTQLQKKKDTFNQKQRAFAATPQLDTLQKAMIPFGTADAAGVGGVSQLYSTDDIASVCTAAMTQSIKSNNGHITGDDFTVLAPNLGRNVIIRLLADAKKIRINSCFPL